MLNERENGIKGDSRIWLEPNLTGRKLPPLWKWGRLWKEWIWGNRGGSFSRAQF